MQQAGHSVSTSLDLVGELEGVQMLTDVWQNGVEQKVFQALHQDGCEGDGAVVIWFFGLYFLGTGIIIAVFQGVGIWQ